MGYLLKDRVTSLDRLSDALRTIAAGGTVLDPEVIAQLLVSRRSDPLRTLTPREREVLSLMAEGRSNAAIANQLVVSGGAVEKHISSIFAKINLPDLRQPPSPRRPHLAQVALSPLGWPQTPECVQKPILA